MYLCARYLRQDPWLESSLASRFQLVRILLRWKVLQSALHYTLIVIDETGRVGMMILLAYQTRTSSLITLKADEASRYRSFRS